MQHLFKIYLLNNFFRKIKEIHIYFKMAININHKNYFIINFI
jgi:hypothetical protein